ncbi:MAG TPA: thiamine pyrophosphate-dependent enzyme [Xanthobacteraceae bacterium]|nr:thiamine pyrophosphate-dependent enzyme [Xanthobacteraceae bacterium]
MTACAQAKAQSDDPAHSRIRILPNGAGVELALCRQCADPICVMNCPAGALTKNAASGVIDWADDKCVGCLLCTAGCAYAGIVYESAVGHVSKCDMCAGDPACVKACPREALELRSARIFNAYADKEDLFCRGLAACHGCNSELLIRHTMRMVGPDAVVAAPPGCIPGMGTVGYNGQTGAKVPIFHSLLTNTATMLAGVKTQYNRVGRDVTAIALAGDGGAADAGFQSLSGAAERNDPILFICVDNEGYMNTGMQSSGVTPYGSWTSTTPVGGEMAGKRTEAKNLPLIMTMHNCSYVATASTAYLEDYYDKLEKAIQVAKTGMAYLHVYAPCPTGWRFPSAMTTHVCRMQVRTNFIALWEYDPSNGLRFTHPVERPEPVANYLNLIGKYRHLSDEQVSHIQRTVDDKIAYLRQLAAMAATRQGAAAH